MADQAGIEEYLYAFAFPPEVNTFGGEPGEKEDDAEDEGAGGDGGEEGDDERLRMALARDKK